MLFGLAAVLTYQSAPALFGPRVGLASPALLLSGAHAHIEHRANFLTVLGVVAVFALLRECVARGPEARPRFVLDLMEAP